MIDFLASFIISIVAAFGLAVALVEKGGDFPIRRYNILLRKFLRNNIYWKAQWVLYCTVCTSFWTTLITDSILFIISGGSYFFWPFSGFATLGLTWLVIDFLNALDSNDAL